MVRFLDLKKVNERFRPEMDAAVKPGAKIGKNCNICSHCFIENDAEIAALELGAQTEVTIEGCEPGFY